MNSEKETSNKFSGDVLDIPGLLHLVRGNIRLIAGCAIVFLIAAVGWTSYRGPVYQATAFLEVDDPREVATIAQKLRFPSVALQAAGDDETKARSLGRRSRVKVVRDSRLIAVTVRGKEKQECAKSADGLVAAFLTLREKSVSGPGPEPESDAAPVETFELSPSGELAATPPPPAAPYAGTPDVWQAEKASVPADPTGPPNILLWAAAAAAGAFSGFLVALLRNS